MKHLRHRLLVALTMLALITACAPQPAPEPAQQTAAPTAAAAATTPPEATAAPSATRADPATATAGATAEATAEATVVAEAPPAGSPTVEPPLFARISVPPITTELPADFKVVETGGFARFQAPAVTTSGSLTPITPAADLEGVVTPFLLSPLQRELIGRNGFVVSPSDSNKFYEVYERNRYGYLPSFISSDSILHGYHKAFSGVLRQSEMSSFAPVLVQLNHAMLATSASYYEQLAGTPWEEAARRNTAYFAVPVALLEPDWQVPEQIADLVLPELEYVRAHDGQHQSPLFPDDPRGEDYSQYTPRGHYTRNEVLSRYFQAMMWHGRRSFTAADYVTGSSEGPAIVRRQEVLMVQALREAGTDEATALELWNAIYEPTSFFVGETDGLTPPEVIPVLDTVYGPIADVRELADDAKLAEVTAALADRRAEVIQDRAKGAGRFELEFTPGLRFMGARLVPDAAIFSELVAPRVDGRIAPKALDVFAAMGSDRALSHLEAAGDTTFDGYSRNMEGLQETFATLDDEVWTGTVYFGWLNTLRPLLDEVPEGYPAFMQSEAWRDKQLHTALGSYAELKHDTLLYAKQFAAEAGFSLPPPSPELPRGYVEPVPLVYARIVGLSEMTRSGLAERGLLSENSADVLDQVIALAGTLQELAEKELRGEALSDDEALWITQYGMALERVVLASEYDPSFASGEVPEAPNGAIVADIATTPEGVIHIGTGKVYHIYVAVPVDGAITVMRGGVYSFYEFTEASRLTDELWRERLDRGEAPERPTWTSSFEVDETQADVFTERILAFNSALVAAFWYTVPEAMDQYLIGAELADTRAFVAQLVQQQQFMGLKRLGFEFRSYDLDGDTATVTTRERWEEKLHSGTSYDYFEDPPAVRERVYTADVTYTLERQDDRWMIAKIVVQEQP